ncbi:hypothetical protein QJS10_CPB20g00828 [Acorus calamus]|uniref:Uncharacterized protein n=1 Tax=Acorus calamus TaxID=4465 RepID=A0AAV9CBI2_ACOCL|nr:hypothetical protein QJS10_CPB20g00828 [Acorus calamus]
MDRDGNDVNGMIKGIVNGFERESWPGCEKCFFVMEPLKFSLGWLRLGLAIIGGCMWDCDRFIVKDGGCHLLRGEDIYHGVFA